MLDEAQLNRIKDPYAKEVVKTMSNLCEQLMTEVDALKIEVQKLRDENNRLKGEQGKPNVKPNKPAQTNTNHSTEKQRQEPKTWKKDTKNDKITVHQTRVINLDKSTLPEDAIFKGYEEYTVQNLRLVLENICFRRAKYYSPSQNKTYLAPLPPGFQGGFAPELKAFAIGLHHLGNVSQPAMYKLFTHAGLSISTGQISHILTNECERFHQEKKEITLAGLKSTTWQQTDDTKTRVNGVNNHCHVLGNPFYSSYTTLPRKDRLSVLDVLKNGAKRTFLLTSELLSSVFVSSLPKKWQKKLATFPQDVIYEEDTLQNWLDKEMPTLGSQQKRQLLEQMALTAYYAQTEVPVVSLLLCDDAPQFPGITDELALCWVHDARHYKKLSPHLPVFQKCLEQFQKKYWKYYKRLSSYRLSPTAAKKKRLWSFFDKTFVADTGYDALDARIRQTIGNKEKLLMVLSHPEIPLHNNASELAVRLRVRKGDVSFGVRSDLGMTAWDTFETIFSTSQKLGVSFLSYLQDRICEKNEMPSLASLITERSQILKLGGSWT